MLTRSNFEMSSWGLSRTGGGQMAVVVGQPEDRLALGQWTQASRQGLRLAVEGLQKAVAASRGGRTAVEGLWAVLQVCAGSAVSVSV